jgi:hypothetical protein
VTAPLRLTRRQVLDARRRAQSLDGRLPRGATSLRRAAWAGLTDSMPRAALLSLHARVAGVGADVLDDPALVQVWGPRFSVYAVAAEDQPVFTLGRLPRRGKGLRRATDLAAQLEDVLGDSEMRAAEAGRALGGHPNRIRYATTTGRLVIRWDGARQPTVRLLPEPDVDPEDARQELARRHLRVLGPSTVEAFASWAGVKPAEAATTFDALRPDLAPVAAPTLGDAWILAHDEERFRSDPPLGSTRLLPSGDTWYLLQGPDRELLVPDADRRERLWTSRVWPGAVMVDGRLVGTWRRSGTRLTVEPWTRVGAAARAAVEAEAATLPLPDGPATAVWA